MMTNPRSDTPRLTMSVVIPVRNALPYADRQIGALQAQSLQPDRVLVLDSESEDGCTALYEAAGVEVRSLPASRFDHGGTRNLGWSLCQTDLVVYLTHDAIPADSHSLARLCEGFADPRVGIISGRQLPRRGAKSIERHARYFNYPLTDNRRQWPEARQQGFRALFNSNAFAGYRRAMLAAIGGFPEGVIFGEDQGAAARALLANWVVVYRADATVEHSHAYTLAEEFRRYFDIGVSHQQNSDLFAPFAGLSGEGNRFVASELAYVGRAEPWRVPEAMLRTALKLLAYRLGRREADLPVALKHRLAMQPGFFERVSSAAE